MSSNRERDREGIRAAYPAQQPLLNLNNAAVSPPPLVVQEATIEAYRFISQNPATSTCGASWTPRSRR